MIPHLMRKHLGSLRGNSVLELGPGYGDNGRIAASIIHASRITYMDCDQEVLKYQTTRNDGNGLIGEIRHSELSPESLREIPGEYDLILCQEVLEHLSSPQAILVALGPKLAEAGRLVVTVPTAVSERAISCIAPGYMKNGPHGHVQRFNKQALNDLLCATGFKVEVCVSTQPHYFLTHLVLFASGVHVEESTGRILQQNERTRIASLILRASRRLFMSTGPDFWGRVFPRNYFVVARRAGAV